MKTSSKRAIQKTIEATGDLIDNEIADETTELHSKMSSAELRSKHDDANSEIEVAEKDTYPQKKDKTLLMN